MLRVIRNYNSLVMMLPGCLFFFSTGVFATEYYVAPMATQILNETDQGSVAWSAATDIENPCSAATAMTHAVAGDVVYFRGGVYELGQSSNNQQGAGVLYPNSSGTSDTNRIIFTAYQDEIPVLNTTVTDENIISRAWGDRGQDYTTIKGFTISSTGATYVGSVGIGDGSVGTVVENCTFLGSSTPGVNTDNISGIAFQSSTYAVIRNCQFSNYRDQNENHNTSAIKTYHAHHLTVSNCEFMNSTLAIYNKQDSDYNIYENNFFYDSMQHIMIAVANTGDSIGGVIRNNIMVNADYVAIILEYNNANLTSDWTINANTIYNSSPSSRSISINNGTGRFVYNNIIVADASEGEVRYVGNSTVDKQDHNLIYSPSLIIRKNEQYFSSISEWKSSNILVGGGSPGEGSIESDPMFVNSSGSFSQIQDFALATGSSARGAGRAGVDMGANVFFVGVSGNSTSPSSVPAAPEDFVRVSPAL